MTESSPVSRDEAAQDETSRDENSSPAGAERAAGQDRFADLAERPVAEHVEVFEDEHGRLQRELGTIDEL